ncbi:MAG: flagellar FlbD family protein [Myxococcales bacterium]|nr:flagellar FlbD family protein [Myxococcales bacterium]
MIKLTRLNHHTVAINPDHIRWAEASPDTTLFLLGGEKILVLETLDELLGRVIEFRRRIRTPGAPGEEMDTITGDPPRMPSKAPPPLGARSSHFPRPSGTPRFGGGT